MLRLFTRIFSEEKGRSVQHRTASTNSHIDQAQTRAPSNEQRTTPYGKDGIRRDDALIQKLKEDHRVLLAMYGDINSSAQAGKWRLVESGLLDFSTTLTDHLLTESIKLYTYLKQEHRTDEDAFASIQSFSSEMARIGKTVKAVLDNYKDISVSPEKQNTFTEDWQGLGHALGKRIQREETSLYPLY